VVPSWPSAPFWQIIFPEKNKTARDIIVLPNLPVARNAHLGVAWMETGAIHRILYETVSALGLGNCDRQGRDAY